MIVGLDIGTTNLKAGLFNDKGDLISAAHRPNDSRIHPDGVVYYDPDRLWAHVTAMIVQLVRDKEPGAIRAIGVTSMAESGLLVDKATGQPRSPILPWFERCSLPQAKRMEAEMDAFRQFQATGLLPSFKYGLAKLLWMKEKEPHALRSSVWLSASAYIAFRLTGAMAEDYTLAARTYAFRITDKRWDAALLRHFGLAESLLPPALPSGVPTGRVTAEVAQPLGLTAGTQVFQAGHDHVCASLAVGAIRPGDVYNSMGTAETMVGAFPARTLTEADYRSGLSYGLHPVAGQLFWMGGHSSSGGSVEWLRELLGGGEKTGGGKPGEELAGGGKPREERADGGKLGEERADGGKLGEELAGGGKLGEVLGDGGKLGYAEISRLLDSVPPEPSGIIFLPYLAGSGAPSPNADAKAAFIGLTSRHGKADILCAVLEGNAYQMEAVRRCAESVSDSPIRLMRVVGGGVRNRQWLQLKADVSGITLEAPDIEEAALAGAAITAGVGAGIYASYEEAAAIANGRAKRIYEPDAEAHKLYSSMYEQFLKLRDALKL